jgi:hypothetical protein
MSGNMTGLNRTDASVFDEPLVERMPTDFEIGEAERFSAEISSELHAIDAEIDELDCGDSDVHPDHVCALEDLEWQAIRSGYVRTF